MKLRRIVSTILAIALVVTAVPIGQIARAEDTTAPTTVNAVDSNYVLGNNTKLSDGALTGSNMGDLRWDRPSLYSDPSGLYKQNDASKNGSLGVEESTYRWPYAALKVSVEQTGTYDVSLVVNSNTGAKYNTFGMMVDGIMHVLSYDKSKAKATVNTQVSLTKGTHILVFTTAMPADPVVAKGLATGDSAAYPWFNFHTFTLGAGLKVLSAPTKQEVINSACTRIEAENTAYVSYVGYESAKTETPTGASSKTVGGVSRGSELKQSFAQLSEYLDKAGMAYVQYAVEAPEDGIYNIRVGYLAGGSGEKPFVTVLVNDTVYKANFDNNWGSLDAPTLAVEMKKGINLIRCTSLTTDQACFSSSWINQDYLDVDSKLTVLDATSWNTINAGDETKVLANQYTDQGDTLESAVTSALRGDCPSLETLHLTGDNLITWPFAAIRVTADDDGYYDFTVNIGPNASSTSKQIAMLVDGEVVCKPFTVAASASVDGSVFLTQGTHILVFTTPMPKTAAEASALTSQTVGNAYPWCNYQSFVIDSRLQVETAPVLDDIREFLGQTIQAVATTKVIYANYKKHNDNNSGIIASPNGDYLKNNRVSLETLLDAGWERAPYTAFEVTVEEDGKYDIYALISTDGGTTSSQLGMIIDGETVKTVAIKKASGKQIVGDSVYLEKGIHLIAFTTPMPLDDAEALAIPEPDTDSWAGMNKAYPWCDVYEFDLGNELVVSDNFTTDKITVSTGDTTKVDKNWCTYKDSDDEDDIADFLGANTDDYHWKL